MNCSKGRNPTAATTPRDGPLIFAAAARDVVAAPVAADVPVELGALVALGVATALTTLVTAASAIMAHRWLLHAGASLTLGTNTGVTDELRMPFPDESRASTSV